MVAVTFTLAAFPRIVLSVMVKLAVPVPDSLPSRSTISPCTPVPPPAVNIESV